MSDSYNPMMKAMRRLSNRSDATAEQMHDFVRRQMAGEKPDPSEFMRVLEQRSTTHSALQAQFKLLEKPMKTVLNETK